jgi:AAA+ superfamily predicted ATPase
MLLYNAAVKKNILPKVDDMNDYYSRIQSLSQKSAGDSFEEGYKNISDYQMFYGESTYEIIKSKVKMTDVLQSPHLKKAIREIIEEYKHRETLKSYGLNYENKILFYGPSGCGKTLTALALANVLQKKIYIVNIATIINSSLGKTSSNLFHLIEDAKSNWGIVFFDEFDALAKLRTDGNDHGELKRVTSALLQIIDFLSYDTILIAATNHLDLIDNAIVRRFGRKIEFNLPDEKLLKDYLAKLIKAAGLKANQSITKICAKKYQGISFAEARDKFLAALKKYIINSSKKGSRVQEIKNEFKC